MAVLQSNYPITPKHERMAGALGGERRMGKTGALRSPSSQSGGPQNPATFWGVAKTLIVKLGPKDRQNGDGQDSGRLRD